MAKLIDDDTEEEYAEQVRLGFQDPSGALPLFEYRDISDLHTRAQGDVTDRIQNRTVRKARTAPTDSQLAKDSIKEPEIPNASKYPKNRVIKTSGGHLIEVDNTPGYERLHIRHKKGTRVEITPNGSVRFIANKNRYTAIAGDEELVVRGNTSIVLESDASIRCEGDMDLQVQGDMKTLVEGNYNLEVQGDVTERFHGNTSRTMTGTYLRDTRGSVTERNLSNYLCWNKGTHTMNIGDATSWTTESTLEIISDDTLTMECEGGYIDITKPGDTDDSYMVSGTKYADNFHAAENIHGAEAHFDSAFLTDLDVSNVIEAESKKATYATTAGQAGSAGTAGSIGAGGSASPTTPSATSPTDQDTPTLTTLEAVDVAEESDSYISAIDRSVFYDNKYNKRKLNTYEVWSRMNNDNLRYDSTWLQDQVNYGAISDGATASSPPVVKRSFSLNNNKLGVGFETLGNKTIESRGFQLQVPSKPLVTVIPDKFKIEDPVTRATRLSPFFTMGNMLGGDSIGAQLIDQGGLSKLQICQNAQLLAFNVLEEFRRYYKDRWTISQGLYNLLDQEKLSSSSINCEFVQGLGVGIQFDEDNKSIYYDAAVWAANNLVFDKIILSYIDYDPDNVNEPTLIITIANGNNSKSLATHFNNEVVSSTNLQELI